MMNCFLIVNCNDYKSTKHLINNIKDYKVVDHILIVDNNSSNEERDLLKNLESDRVEIFYNDENLGYSNAINVGSRYLIEKYNKCNLIISNSDVVIMSEEDLIKLIDTLKHDGVGVVGPQVLENGVISRGFRNPSPLVDAMFNLKLFRKLFRDRKLFYPDSVYDSDYTSVDVVSCCFFLIKSETLQQINFMDEKLFLYYEDCILGKKIRDLGLISVIVNDVRIKHFRSVSVDKIYGEIDKLVFFYESQLYFHTTYNDTNAFEIMMLGITQTISLFSKGVFKFVKKL